MKQNLFRMGRKWTVAMAVVAMAATAGIVGSGSATAMLAANGTVTCTNGGGTGKFVPQLLAAGSGTTVKTKFAGKMVCTSTFTPGTVPFTVHTASFKGAGRLVDPSSPPAANGCPSFTSADLIQAIKVKITWPGASPAIAPTVVTYTAGSIPLVSNNAGSDRLSMPSGSTTTISGSFATATNALVVLDTVIPNACTSGWGPVPTFTFGTTSLIKIF